MSATHLSDPFLAYKYQRFHRFAASFTGAIALVPLLFWGWDWVVDPQGARNTWGLRLLMSGAVMLVPFAVRAYRRNPLWAWGIYVGSAATEVLLCLVLERLHDGARHGEAGFVFFFLFTPLAAFIAPLWLNACGMLLLVLTPALTYLLTGLPSGLQLPGLMATLAPTAALVTYILAMFDRLIRGHMRQQEADAWRLAALDCVQEPVLVANAVGRVEYVNPALCRRTGYAAERLHGRHYAEFLVNPPEVGQLRDNASVELQVRCRDGTTLWMLGSVSPVNTAFGAADRTVFVGHDITGRKHEELALRDAALRDAVTGLANRRYFEQRLAEQIEAGPGCALLFIDLDGFKTINDRYGHEVGDRLLGVVAARLLAALRESDLVARLGGDEFAALLAPVAGGQTEALALAQRVLTQLTAPITLDGRDCSVGASMGVALHSTHGNTPAALLAAADAAMYAIKRSGKGGVALAQPVVSAHP